MNQLLIIKIAFRNVFLHKMRTLVIGMILTFGAFLAVLGHTFVNAVASGMENSTTQSITGDIQIYNKDTINKLSVFGNMDGSPSDIGHVENFTNVKEKLSSISNIKAVVPMGTSMAQFNPQNILDTFLEKLRKSYKSGVPEKELDSQILRIRFLTQEVQKNLDGKFEEIGILSKEDSADAQKNLKTVNSDEFWKDFSSKHEEKIEFIANKIAPLIFDNNMIFFNYVGTDPAQYEQFFPQFEIVKGEKIPPNQRGFLFHDYFYENYIKHRIARRLDQIKKKMLTDKLTIKDSKEIQDQIKANIEQSAEIYLQLGPIETEDIKNKLKVLLADNEDNDFRSLIKKYLDMKDDNFAARYDFFYKEIAPFVVLYRVKVGDILPLNAFTKNGTSTSINIKFYGTFKFKSYENSPLAGNFSLMDLVSLRELYGFMTEERREQNKEIEKEMGLSDVGKDDIENLFSQNNQASEAKKEKTQINNEVSFKTKVLGDRYSPEELNNGVFLHAAVLLNDSSKMKKTIDEINALSDKEKLKIQAVSWQEAAGFIGQMTFMMKVVLNIFIGISLLLACLMIMNSLLMAMMNRKQEIGTMRAIGAHTNFIYKLFFYETTIISVMFSGLGIALASLFIGTVGAKGIPASGDVATFFFSGPRLFLHLDFALLFIVLILILIFSLLATQYPAWKAMKISPLQAMNKKE